MLASPSATETRRRPWTLLQNGKELLRGSWEDCEVVATVRLTCFTKSWVGQVVWAFQPTGMR